MEQNTENTAPKILPRPTKSFTDGLIEWAKVIAIALFISLPIRYFVAEPFVVNGASMDPTFASGQFLIVDRISYKFSEPKRGDVIVFEYPNNPSIYYIKRIIGLPGETVKIKDGIVTVENKDFPKGFALNEPYIDISHKSQDTLIEKLNSNEYFVMGDNRNQSSDSRAWGPLEYSYIVGKPALRLLPFNAISVTPGEYHEKNK